MSKSLDIAKILRATEISNPDNNQLIWVAEGALDSAVVQNTPMSYYSSLDSLPTSNLTLGAQAFVEENRRLYISDGNGWYNTSFFASALPRWIIEPDASYTIEDSATPLTITALANDSDNPNLINQSILSDSGQYLVDVTIDSSIFTFIPKSQDSIGQEVTAGNLIDSNTNSFSYTFKFSDGINIIQKLATISYSFELPFVNGGDRGFVFAGVQYPSVYNSTTQAQNASYVGIQYFDTTTPGNASSFGSLDAGSVNAADYPGSNNSWASYMAGNMSNGTRALVGAGGTYQSLTGNDYIQYITCATFGSVAIFGQLTRAGYAKAGASDGTKALMTDGGTRQQIDYVTIDTTGNAQDFGDLQSYSSYCAGFSDGVKCVWNSAQSSSYGYEYVTASTLSNASTFGSPVNNRYRARCAHANTTYGMTMGGQQSSTNTSMMSDIEYITISTLGNATDWGSNLPAARYGNSGTGNSTTAFSCGGEDSPSTTGYSNNIYAISMSVVGNNASDFGDLAVSHTRGVGNSGNAA